MSAQPATEANQIASKLIGALNRRLLWLGWLALLATVLSWFSSIAWWLDLATHFRWQYAALALVALAAALLARRWRASALFAALALWHGFALMPAWVEAPWPGPSRHQAIRIFYSNLAMERFDRAALNAMLTEHYDVVALVELTPASADLLSASLAKDFPHAALHPDNSPFGLGIWSRAPILDRTVSTGDGLLTAQLQLTLADASNTELLLLHPVPPLGAAFSQARDRQIAQVAEQVAGRDLIILGDFNASPWSHSMRALTASGFKHAGAGWTRWPTWYGRSMLFAVPIDHVYLQGNWQTLDYRVGPDIGSDHRPLSVLLQRLE